VDESLSVPVQDTQLSQRDRAAGCVIGEKRKIRAIAKFKVIEVHTNRKSVCDFLLVINSN